MSTSQVTLPVEPNPVFEVVEAQNDAAVQETVVQSNPAVGAVTVQTTTELQPTEASATAIQTMQEVNQILQQTEVQQQILEGESVALIASETGQSVNQVDNELGIPPALPSEAILAGAPQPTAATDPEAVAAAAIASYVAVPGVTGPGSTAQAQLVSPGSTLSVEI